ncbi:MAG: putative Ig domain-containing protein, partial [Candidatus Pacearchaeota archaeon]|nr:putative Ig domain-containing protein [Candidatus Pacearchaeota archaeon]
MNTLSKKLLIIPFALVFLVVLVSAASITTSLFYNSTTSNSLQIINRQSAGVIISADSLFESSMAIKLDLRDSSGNLVNNLLNVYTTRDSYFNDLIVGQSAYLTQGNYTIVSTVTAASGQSNTATLHLEVLPVTASNNVPVITSTAITSVNESASYFYQVIATDSDGDALTYSLTQTPTWLSINSATGWLSINSATGLISGTAPSVTADENYAVIVSVSDSTDSAIQIFTLVV